MECDDVSRDHISCSTDGSFVSDRLSKSSDDRRHKKKEKKKSHGSDKRRKKHRLKKEKKRSKRKKKHKKGEKKRKLDREHDDEISKSSNSSSSSLDEHVRKSSDRKRDRQGRKRKKKSSNCKDADDERSEHENESGNNVGTANYQAVVVAEAIRNLLKDKLGFASELPLILIRLAGGTTFDLRQVSSANVAIGLQSIFEALEPFGVKKDDKGMWMFQNPSVAGPRDEMVLLRLVRSLLNDVGLTMDEIVSNIEEKRKNSERSEEEGLKQPTTMPLNGAILGVKGENIKDLTKQLLATFQSSDGKFRPQLAGLCKTIAEGESVSIDGLPDEKLKTSLENLFVACGLEKSEIDDDESDKEAVVEGTSKYPLMGFGIPDSTNDTVHIRLAAIMAACREGPPKRRMLGPMQKPTTQQAELEASALYGDPNLRQDEENESEEDEGPMLPGAARRKNAPALAPDLVKAQAEYRELELKATAAGIPMPLQQGGREEWMIVPGKYDFLSGVKSGQSIKNRGFQNKKSRDNEKPVAPIHPAVQAEMDAIMQAHQDARGPSLIDQHQAKLQKEKEAPAAYKKKEWKWRRDKDLDAGRRVDKDALGMILGGAADNLKTKFQGGFNG